MCAQLCEERGACVDCEYGREAQLCEGNALITGAGSEIDGEAAHRFEVEGIFKDGFLLGDLVVE